jgi:hypothetical protein
MVRRMDEIPGADLVRGRVLQHREHSGARIEKVCGAHGVRPSALAMAASILLRMVLVLGR